MLGLFAVGGTLLAWIFNSWQSERSIRHWEHLRLLSHKQLDQGRQSLALQTFKKAADYAAILGKSNFRYALSLQDLARYYEIKGDYKNAREFLSRALIILSRNQSSDMELANAIADDRILAQCQLSRLDLISGSGLKDAWQDLKEALELFQNSKDTKKEPLIEAAIKTTLLSVYESCLLESQLSLAAEIKRTIEEESRKDNKLSYLQNELTKKQRLHVKDAEGRDLEQLSSEVSMLIKNQEFDEARKLLKQAKELSANDPDFLRKLQLQSARLDFCENNFEAAEKLAKSICENKESDTEQKAQATDQLLLIYRACGEKPSYMLALREKMPLTEKIYGKQSYEYVTEELTLIRELQVSGKEQEAEPFIKHAFEFHKRTGKTSERLAAALIREGKAIAPAAKMLDKIIDEIGDNERIRFDRALALSDLAGMQLKADAAEKAEASLKSSLALYAPFTNKQKIVCSEHYLDWGRVLKDKTKSDIFLKAAVAQLPLPQSRQEALREKALLKDLVDFKPEAPEAPNIRLIKAEIQKFKAAELEGLVN
ncbi:MAG: hypothetical protein K2X27_09330 [Candidatus Obscuribacterales bacterium]|nr:hypothetical protein [Candidatus Obscuribacterales bacterium]